MGQENQLASLNCVAFAASRDPNISRTSGVPSVPLAFDSDGTVFLHSIVTFFRSLFGWTTEGQPKGLICG